MDFKLSIKTLSPIKLGRVLKPALDKAMATAKPKIAALIIDRVTAQADKALKRMAPRYKSGLSQSESIKVTPTGVEVTLMDPVAAAIENGGSAYDIKKVMLAKATKSSKGGVPYVDVPFTHEAGSIPKNVRSAVARKAKREGTSTTQLSGRTPGKKFTRNLNVTRLQALRFGMPGTKQIKQQVRHKQGIHDNLTRRRSAGAAASYQTIRRISAHSSASSWWHPGFKGLKLLQKVVPPLMGDIRDIVRDSLRAAGIPTK